MIPIDNLSLTSLILPFLIGTMLGCCFFSMPCGLP